MIHFNKEEDMMAGDTIYITDENYPLFEIFEVVDTTNYGKEIEVRRTGWWDFSAHARSYRFELPHREDSRWIDPKKEKRKISRTLDAAFAEVEKVLGAEGENLQVRVAALAQARERGHLNKEATYQAGIFHID